MTLALPFALAAAVVAPPGVLVARPSTAVAMAGPSRCAVAACTTPDCLDDDEATLTAVPFSPPAIGAAEIAVIGVALASLAAFGIDHPVHDRTPFLAIAAVLGVLLTAGEGLLPDSAAAMGREMSGKSRMPDGRDGRDGRSGDARMAMPDSELACYIVDGVQTETGDLVVCTPQPQEFAWFHGIDLGQLREIDTENYFNDEAVECESEVSYNGEEEWYCR